MDMVVIHVILVLFPMFVYLFFSCFDYFSDERVSRLLFIITIFTSLYLNLNFYEFLGSQKIVLIFCNIPILVCYLKKECQLGFLVSLLIILVGYWQYNLNVYTLGIKYLIYFLGYLLLYKRVNFRNLYYKFLAVILGFFISFDYFFETNQAFNKVFDMIGYTLVVYFITILSIYLFNVADNNTKMYIKLNGIEKDKNIKNSLFKLTHEIKNPLAVVSGYLDMMDVTNIEKTRKYMNIIKTEIDRSLNIIQDFSDYTKIKVMKEEFDVTVLLKEVYDSFKLILDNKDINFKYEEKYDEVYINSDYSRLEQVLVNLLKNSLEAIENNGIIEMNLEVVDDKVIIYIKDNGIGMNEEELKHLSEMFYTTKKNGTGLGVALSLEIINRLDGEIKYESVKNVGTTCKLILPM